MIDDDGAAAAGRAPDCPATPRRVTGWPTASLSPSAATRATTPRPPRTVLIPTGTAEVLISPRTERSIGKERSSSWPRTWIRARPGSGGTRWTRCWRSRGRAGAFPAGRADGEARRRAVAGALLGEHALPQHHPARPAAAASGRPGDRAQDPLATSAGTRWRSCCGPTRSPPSWAGTSRASSPSATLYDTGFMHFWHAPIGRAWRRPGLRPGPLLARHLRARLPRGPAAPRSSCSASARRSTAAGCRPTRIPG